MHSGKIKTSVKKEIRAELIQKHDSKCYYCNTKCIDYNQDFQGLMTPRNAATIEHLYDKSDIRRLLAGNDRKYMVLSCHWCNYKRGRKSNLLSNGYDYNRTLLRDIYSGKYKRSFII